MKENIRGTYRAFKISTAELRTPIDVYYKTQTGSGGFKTDTYLKLISAKCRWVNDHGLESLQANADQIARRSTVTMRYHASVIENCRIVMGGITYEIVSNIDNVWQRNEWIQFKVQAVVNA